MTANGAEGIYLPPRKASSDTQPSRSPRTWSESPFFVSIIASRRPDDRHLGNYGCMVRNVSGRPNPKSMVARATEARRTSRKGESGRRKAHLGRVCCGVGRLRQATGRLAGKYSRLGSRSVALPGGIRIDFRQGRSVTRYRRWHGAAGGRGVPMREERAGRTGCQSGRDVVIGADKGPLEGAHGARRGLPDPTGNAASRAAPGSTAEAISTANRSNL